MRALRQCLRASSVAGSAGMHNALAHSEHTHWLGHVAVLLAATRARQARHSTAATSILLHTSWLLLGPWTIPSSRDYLKMVVGVLLES